MAYSYNGEIGTLDHSLASASLAKQALSVAQWHTNAYRASVHDPVLININLAPAAVSGDWDGDGDVDIMDIRGLMSAK